MTLGKNDPQPPEGVTRNSRGVVTQDPGEWPDWQRKRTGVGRSYAGPMDHSPRPSRLPSLFPPPGARPSQIHRQGTRVQSFPDPTLPLSRSPLPSVLPLCLRSSFRTLYGPGLLSLSVLPLVSPFVPFLSPPPSLVHVDCSSLTFPVPVHSWSSLTPTSLPTLPLHPPRTPYPPRILHPPRTPHPPRTSRSL